MAKKAKTSQPIQPVIKIDQYPRPPRKLSKASYIAQLRQQAIEADDDPDWQGTKAYYAMILHRFASLASTGDTILDLGDGWKRYNIVIPENADPQTREDIACCIRAMDSLLLIENELKKPPAARDARVLGLCAYKVGVVSAITEHLRPYERRINDSWRSERTRYRAGKSKPKTHRMD